MTNSTPLTNLCGTNMMLLLPLCYIIVISLSLASASLSGQQQLNNYNSTTRLEDSSATMNQYYYTRTRNHPNHLRVSEELKNQYVEDVPYESEVNGTKYEYYKSSATMSYDEMVFEIIDKIFRHRLSPFYIHHYDSDEDKRHSSNPARVSQESCARDLLYLVEKLPKRSLFKTDRQQQQQHQQHYQEDDRLTPELTAFFDSYARQEAGLLMGNTFWVGAYDQCVNRHIFDVLESPAGHRTSRADQQQVVSFKGQYCVSSLKAPVWDQMIEAKKRRAKNYFKTERQMREYSRLFRLQVGICLPDSCDSTAFERHRDEIKLLTKSSLDSRYADYDLIDLYCLPDETSPLRKFSTSALAFMVVMALWTSAVLLATFLDFMELYEGELAKTSTPPVVKQQQKQQHRPAGGMRQFVCWFSLRANYRKLMHVSPGEAAAAPASEKHAPKRATEVTPDAQSGGESNLQNTQRIASITGESGEKKNIGQDAQGSRTSHRNELKIDLRFLNAFKAMIMFWIINGHIMLLMIQTAKNILDSDALLNGLMHFLIGATFGVDLFFTMTGFLTSYLMFNSGHAYKMKITTWIYLSFHRYWRLAPMYLLAFWFSRSVMQSLGAGPLWDYGTSNITFRGLCNSESWWYPLTLTSNLHGLFEECMITSWYISCDMQFWLVSPVFIYLLAKSPVQGWFVTILTILASSKVRYDALLSDKSARYDELVQPRADIFMRVSHDLPALYTHPHYRIAAYLVGLLAGHYVYMLKSRKWTSVLTCDLGQEQQHLKTETHYDKDNKQRELDKTTDESDELKSLDDDMKERNKTTKTNDNDDENKEALTNNENKKKSNGKITITTEKQKLSLTRVQRGRRTRNVLAILGLVMFLLMAFVSYLLANYFPTQYLKYSKPLAAICYSVDHLVMSVGASLIIITLCLGQWPSFVRFLSHPNWSRLSKINYALLLLQCEAIYYQIFRYDQVPMAGTKELINILFNLLVTLYPLAFLVTLVLEFPLANIEKKIIKSK